MKMEDHFKESLNRAVANEPPLLDAWDRFEQRVAGGLRVRLFAAIAAAAALAVASVIVVPRLGTSSGIGLSNEPSSSPSVDPYAGWQTLTNPSQRYLVRFAADWTTSVFEGVQSFQPPGVEPVNKGEPTFFVSIQLRDGWACPTSPPKCGIAGRRDDGRTFYRLEVDYGEANVPEAPNGEAHLVTYAIDWRAGCPDGCAAEASTLFVIVRGDTDDLWSKYSEVGLKLVDSIEYREWPNNVVTQTR
jgi:hypothetical protein